MTTVLPHFFIGPAADEVFKSQARAFIEKPQIRGKCVDHRSSFTAFVAQDLDGDTDLELWTINEREHTAVVLTD